MNKSSCKDCGYYQQHYTFDNRHIFRVYCGHCTFIKVKKKFPDSKICEHFIPGEPDESAFARKEYLSRELLQYLLHLELLPEIKNIDQAKEDRWDKQEKKPSLCKGGWHGKAVTGGLFGRLQNFTIPQSFASQNPAPFTQGGLFIENRR